MYSGIIFNFGKILTGFVLGFGTAFLMFCLDFEEDDDDEVSKEERDKNKKDS